MALAVQFDRDDYLEFNANIHEFESSLQGFVDSAFQHSEEETAACAAYATAAGLSCVPGGRITGGRGAVVGGSCATGGRGVATGFLGAPGGCGVPSGFLCVPGGRVPGGRGAVVGRVVRCAATTVANFFTIVAGFERNPYGLLDFHMSQASRATVYRSDPATHGLPCLARGPRCAVRPRRLPGIQR